MNKEYVDICLRSLEWARRRNYTGYSKFDALNSPLLRTMSGNSRMLRSGMVFGMSRMPINIRPALLVGQGQNPKGLALFARAYFNMYQVLGDEGLKEEGLRLLDVLLGLSQRDKYSGHCWGYNHPWQNVAFYIPANEPNCVVTCAVGQAFLQGYELTNKPEYLEVCQSAASFILKDLRHIDVGPGKWCCSYDLHSDWKVVNVNALASAYLAQLYRHCGKSYYKAVAQAMMRWVIGQKTAYHAWYYTDPPDASRITHDNYHTGFILDSLQDYLAVIPEPEVATAWRNGLAFYKGKLFTPHHEPKWMYDRIWPHDIHGAAQGVITFARSCHAERLNLEFARRILNWTLRNLYEPRASRFYYQQGKSWTKKYTLMRWCQGWGTYAISVFLRTLHSQGKDKTNDIADKSVFFID